MTITWDSVRKQVLANPEVKAEYEALKPEFDFARRVIAMRSTTGLTQREFAEQIGIKQSQLARIESGKQMPKLETLARVAAAAGYKIEVSFLSSQQQEIEPIKIRVSIDELKKISRESITRKSSRELIKT